MSSRKRLTLVLLPLLLGAPSVPCSADGLSLLSRDRGNSEGVEPAAIAANLDVQARESFDIAQIQMAQGNLEEAIKNYIASGNAYLRLANETSTPQRQQWIDSLLTVGRVQIMHNLAAESFFAADKSMETLGWNEMAAETYLNADQNFRSGFSFLKSKDSTSLARSNYKISAYQYQRDGDHLAAAQLFVRIANRHSSGTDDESRTNLFFLAGDEFILAGHPEQALVAYAQIAGILPSHKDAATMHIKIANVHMNLERYQAAANSYAAAGNQYVAAGQRSDARKAFVQARICYEKLSLHEKGGHKAVVLGHAASAAADSGDFAGAIQLNKEAQDHLVHSNALLSRMVIMSQEIFFKVRSAIGF